MSKVADRTQLADMLTACDKATDGPWYVSDAHGLCVVAQKEGKHHHMTMVADLAISEAETWRQGSVEDADFMVMARKFMPKLLNALLLLMNGDGASPDDLRLIKRDRLEMLVADALREDWGE